MRYGGTSVKQCVKSPYFYGALFFYALPICVTSPAVSDVPPYREKQEHSSKRSVFRMLRYLPVSPLYYGKPYKGLGSRAKPIPLSRFRRFFFRRKAEKKHCSSASVLRCGCNISHPAQRDNLLLCEVYLHEISTKNRDPFLPCHAEGKGKNR